MTFRYAIVRKPGENFYSGLTTVSGFTPDYKKLQKQHGNYIQILQKLGIQVIELPALPEFPDAYFVEDTALIFPETAIITRPGDLSRREETEHIKSSVAKFRELKELTAPATLDGGDVLTIGKKVFVGISSRTNTNAVEQLQLILTEYGYEVFPVEVAEGLHLKSEVNLIAPETLLISEQFTSKDEFSTYRQIIVADDERYAANSLWLNGYILMPSGFPKTKELLSSLPYPVLETDTSEARNMDGGLTCMSLRIP